MAWELRSVAPRELATYQEAIVDLYRDAFSVAPYSKGDDEAQEFARFLPQHAEQEGFRLLVALAPGRELAGYAYGLVNKPEQGWVAHVARAMDPDAAATWLTGSFRLAEMAVASHAQGQGLGGRLHDALLRGLTQRRAVLSTMRAKTPAFALYRSRGWRVLVEELHVPGLARTYRVMGRELRPGGGETSA